MTLELFRYFCFSHTTSFVGVGIEIESMGSAVYMTVPTGFYSDFDPLRAVGSPSRKPIPIPTPTPIISISKDA